MGPFVRSTSPFRPISSFVDLTRLNHVAPPRELGGAATPSDRIAGHTAHTTADVRETADVARRELNAVKRNLETYGNVAHADRSEPISDTVTQHFNALSKLAALHRFQSPNLLAHSFAAHERDLHHAIANSADAIGRRLRVEMAAEHPDQQLVDELTARHRGLEELNDRTRRFHDELHAALDPTGTSQRSTVSLEHIKSKPFYRTTTAYAIYAGAATFAALAIVAALIRAGQPKAPKVVVIRPPAPPPPLPPNGERSLPTPRTDSSALQAMLDRQRAAHSLQGPPPIVFIVPSPSQN